MSDYRHLRGKKVRVPRGTPITSTYPGKRYRTTRRAVVVEVKHVHEHQCGETTVSWAGAGGYWMDAPARLVQEVTP